MALLSVVPSIEDAYAAFGGRDGLDVYVTSAKSDERSASTYAERGLAWRAPHGPR